MSGWFARLFTANPPLPAIEPAPKPKRFSYPVDAGFVDDLGKWWPSESEAEYASAMRYMQVLADKVWWVPDDVEPSLRQSDAMRAMAILSGEYAD